MTTTATRRPATDEKIPSTGALITGYRGLAEALKTLALPAAGRKPLPVFSRILVTVRADEIELTTFDFDTAATVTLPATGTSPGQLLLDHPSLTKVLSAAVKGSRKATVDQLDVTIDTPDHTPVVHVAGYSIPLDDTVTVDAFPALPATTAPTHVVDREALSVLVDRVTVAADRGDTLPILTGINATLDKGSMTLTATDRYRLASGTIPANGTTTEKVLIPAATLAKLLPRRLAIRRRQGRQEPGHDHRHQRCRDHRPRHRRGPRQGHRPTAAGHHRRRDRALGHRRQPGLPPRRDHHPDRGRGHPPPDRPRPTDDPHRRRRCRLPARAHARPPHPLTPSTEGLHPDHSGRGPSSCPTVAAGMGCHGGGAGRWNRGRVSVVGGSVEDTNHPSRLTIGS